MFGDGLVTVGPQEPGVDVALDHGMNVATRILQPYARLADGVLLRVDERVGRAVQQVVAQHA